MGDKNRDADLSDWMGYGELRVKWGGGVKKGRGQRGEVGWRGRVRNL